MEEDKNKVKEKAWQRKRKGRETRCSPWVAWSRSCPINTGEQLDRHGPPGWLTAESSHWPPALCYMTPGVQLNWQREAACISQTVGGSGWMATPAHACARLFKMASTHGGHNAANTVIHPHTLRQEESNTTFLHRWAGEGNTLVPQLVSARKWGGVGLGGDVCCVPTESFPHDGPRAVFVNCTLEQQGVR